MATKAEDACAILASYRSKVVRIMIEIQQFANVARTKIRFMRGVAEGALNLPSLPLPSEANFALYSELRGLCPQLNLPAMDSQILINSIEVLSNIDSWRRSVYESYASILDSVESGPLAAIDALESQYQQLVTEALEQVEPIFAAIDCACGAVQIAQDIDVARAKAIYEELKQQPSLIADRALKSQIDAYKRTKDGLQALRQDLAFRP